ncbi:MAG: ParA family protein, partial [Pyrobaculum sp.]
ILTEWVAYMPKFVQKLRLPVDTVVIDTAAALRVEVLAKLHGQGVFNIFMSDRRLISRISDVKTEQYRRYIAYSSLVVVNMVEKDELKMAKRIAPVALRRVSIDEYYSDAVTNSILRDRENRKAVSTILERIKLA